MAASKWWRLGIGLLLVLAGCAPSVAVPQRIALLAPFEGRYRELGYELLYAARLAIADSGSSHVELLPVDDGGTAESAALRAQALAANPYIVAVIAAGYPAASVQAQAAYGDLPVVVIGGWAAGRTYERAYLLAHPEIAASTSSRDLLALAEQSPPLVGGDVLALRAFIDLYAADPADMTIVSAASLPDAAFRERYLASDLYVPEPGLLATTGYDAAWMLAAALQDQPTRDLLAQRVAAVVYDGLTGRIAFDPETGFWQAPPFNRFRYDPVVGGLVLVDDSTGD